MLILLVHLYFLFNLLFTIISSNTPAYNPTDYIQMSCGSSSITISDDGRRWYGESSPIDPANISAAVTATKQEPSVPAIPFLNARISRSQFSYILPVVPGKKFLRLYFYPASYSGGLNKTDSFFTVKANDYTLLSNFSPLLAVSAEEFSPAYLVKEFIINIQHTTPAHLNVTFLPSLKSYAFVNGIEVVSTPDGLYMGNHDLNANPLKFVNSPNVQFEFDQNKTAFEALYRLNVGEQAVSAVDDTGMYRVWASDEKFLWGGDRGNPLSNDQIAVTYTPQTPNYTAPTIVYTTARAMGQFSTRFNLSWYFPSIDSGFYYLLRLHFCEINPDLITKENQRVFIIFINNVTAEAEADVIYWAHGPGIPVFKDYIVFVPEPPEARRTKQDLFLALHPNLEVEPKYYDAILNGLELFRLISFDGSLADLPVAPNTKLPNKGRSEKSRVLIAVVGGAVGGTAVVLIIGFLIFRQRRRGLKDFDQRNSSKTNASGSSPLPLNLCRRFLLEEIRSATANFDAKLVIGTGGFGNVYKGHIDNGLTTVAIKRLNPSSSQGAHEFETEIEMLSNLRYLHLVSLIGYCDEKGEMILVYDYMANGTLRDHLNETENPPLPWKRRLHICIGAAKGLHYLHAGTQHNIIHRDVKSTNILLDEKWVAKVSDFGLSKLGPTSGIHSHVSTQVKGSFGYIDPEYFRLQQLTDKSDVYSFGVVLFEVLCGRPAIVPSLSVEQVNLAEWSKRHYKKGMVDQIVDPIVKEEIAPECLRFFAETAKNCLKDRGVERPGMNDVVLRLEYALQLQEAAENGSSRPPFAFLMHGGDVQTTTKDDTDVLSESGGDQYLSLVMESYGSNYFDRKSNAGNDKLKSDFL